VLANLTRDEFAPLLWTCWRNRRPPAATLNAPWTEGNACQGSMPSTAFFYRQAGVPRSTLYRWGKDAAPRNRRPRRVRPKTWTPALRQAAERLRQDFPMWGGAKIGPLLRAEGFEVSDATVGRAHARRTRGARRCSGRADLAPTPPMRAAGRPSAASHAACRGLAVTEPGGSSSSTPSSSISPPPKRSSTSPPMIRSPNGTSAKLQPRLRTSRCSLPR
jgi:hypothetical protein